MLWSRFLLSSTVFFQKIRDSSKCCHLNWFHCHLYYYVTLYESSHPTFGDRSKASQYIWYHCYFHVIIILLFVSFPTRPLGIIPKPVSTVGITVIFIFHNFFMYLVWLMYSFIFSFSFIFSLFHWKSKINQMSYQLTQVLDIWQEFCLTFVSQSSREYYAWTFLETNLIFIYHLSAVSNFWLWHSSECITFPTHSCLLLYSFWVSFLLSLFTPLSVLYMTLHNSHSLFSCVLSVFALT